MSEYQFSSTPQPDQSAASYLLRWRGRQEGPYSLETIETKLASNQIGLLHEIAHNGQWITLREYFAELDALRRAEQEAREEGLRRAREEEEHLAKLREEQRQSEILAEERRKNDLLQASLNQRQGSDSTLPSRSGSSKSHRAGSILALGIIGLICCGPLCIAAWLMGDSDLREMDAGIMDSSGRSTTSTGRSLGMIGTILWVVGVIFFIIF